jgi:hypothetical protein
MVESSCARNQHVPQMLATLNLTECTHNNDGSDDGDTNSDTDFVLLPSLFLVARQVPHTELNNMLIGLLAFHDEQ